MSRPVHPIRAALALAVAAAVLAGCHAFGRPPAGPAADWNLTPAQRDSLEALFERCDRLRRENRRLRARVETAELEAAKSRVLARAQADTIALLGQELRGAEADLARVERQFVRLERHLEVVETKASAVAAIAEAQLLLDRLGAGPGAPVDSATAAEVGARLAEADRMVRRGRFAAAVYYATRATRILKLAETRARLAADRGVPRLVRAARVNLRAGPGRSHRVIARLHRGEVVYELGRRDPWRYVRRRGGAHGWVHADLLR